MPQYSVMFPNLNVLPLIYSSLTLTWISLSINLERNLSVECLFQKMKLKTPTADDKLANKQLSN